MSVHKWLFSPNSSMLSKFNPRNINYMPVVKSIERLDLEQNISFLDRHELVGRMVETLFVDIFCRAGLTVCFLAARPSCGSSCWGLGSWSFTPLWSAGSFSRLFMAFWECVLPTMQRWKEWIPLNIRKLHIIINGNLPVCRS